MGQMEQMSNARDHCFCNAGDIEVSKVRTTLREVRRWDVDDKANGI